MANASLRCEAAALAGLCQVLRVIPAGRLPDARKKLPGVMQGEKLCEAFELFRDMVSATRLSFEQLVYLVFAVAEGQECSLDHCTSCRAVILIDHLSLARRVCVHCQEAEVGVTSRDEPEMGESEAETVQEPPPEGFQHRLFD